VTDWTGIVGRDFAVAGGPDDRVDGVSPSWVVRPGSVEEVQSVVRSGARLVASGLGGHLEIGASPRALDVLLRVDRIARVVDHQAADMTVTVEAGCPLPALQALLATSGQWLALDPPRPGRTTIGGLVAANLSGPLRASQGTVRDLLLGCTVVGAGGVVVRSGGRVVKNVAGYDLPKLHIGALGTVGVLVEATFKVRPRPERESAVVVACRTPGSAAALALAVRDAFDPLWLEVAGSRGLGDGPGSGAAVAVGVAGSVAEVEHGCARVHGVAEAHGCRATNVDDGAALRVRLADFDAEPAAALLRAAILPSEVGATLEAIESAARAQGAELRTLAHAANGIVRVAVARPEPVAALVRELRPRLEASGGSLVVHRATPDVKATVDPWGDPGPGRGLMRRLKQAFDPDDVFAPGRLIGD
jgi:glycolate oxidase FAD binding subunit